ncbi:polysaccharide pyruvyl transferase [Salipiger aestuarii]|nr:polysaccharide pyruvyl transferase [Salipiger aestuarii]
MPCARVLAARPSRPDNRHRQGTPMAPLRITLIMHSTRSDNLGVGALTVAEVDILRRLAAEAERTAQITIVDFKDARTPYVTGDDIRIVDLDRRFMTRPGGYLALARASDMVVDIGAGDSFADIYGSARLKKMFLLKALTHLAGTPLVLAPQTIGPFTGGWTTRAALASIRRSAVVATRDALSTQALRDMGFAGAAIEASDVALRLPYTPPAPRPEGAQLRVGLNVSGLLMAGGYAGGDKLGEGDYPDLIRRLIRHFTQELPGIELHLVPHVIVAGGRMQIEDDQRASAALAREFPDVVLAPAFASPSEAKSYIAGMDFFAGARMHACIAAFSSGVPVVPMAYSRKFAGLFGTLGYDHTVNCTGSSADAVFAAVTQGWDTRKTLARDLATALPRGLARLDVYEAALRALIARIPAR